MKVKTDPVIMVLNGTVEDMSKAAELVVSMNEETKRVDVRDWMRDTIRAVFDFNWDWTKDQSDAFAKPLILSKKLIRHFEYDVGLKLPFHIRYNKLTRLSISSSLNRNINSIDELAKWCYSFLEKIGSEVNYAVTIETMIKDISTKNPTKAYVITGVNDPVGYGYFKNTFESTTYRVDVKDLTKEKLLAIVGKINEDLTSK